MGRAVSNVEKLLFWARRPRDTAGEESKWATPEEQGCWLGPHGRVWRKHFLFVYSCFLFCGISKHITVQGMEIEHLFKDSYFCFPLQNY